MRIYKTCLLVCVLMMAGCGGQQQDVEIPTLFPTTVEEATTQALPSAIPSSPTEMASALPPTATSGFPATWTPEVLPTDVPATPTVPAQVLPVATQPGPLPACETFAPDYTRIPSDFTVGAEPTIYWFAVEGALNYEVVLTREDTGERIGGGYTDQASFTFPPDLFEAEKRYGWAVTPYDTRIVQMCATIGDVFVVRR